MLLHGSTWGCTNQALRTQIGLVTIESNLRVPRLRFLQRVMRAPPDHVVFLAAVSGAMDSERARPLDSHGIPWRSANPWLVQYWRDVLELCHYIPGFREQLSWSGWTGLPQNDMFLTFKADKVCSFCAWIAIYLWGCFYV